MRYDVIAIGASWGGLQAVGTVLEGVPVEIDQPIVVAQHRSAESARGVLESLLQLHSARPVVEPGDKEPIEPAHVYVAPADYHLLVDDGQLSLSVDPAVRFSRPSIDVLFESAAESYGEDVVGIVLTGANDDGCRGVLAIKDAGGLVFVQDPATAERPEMPEAAIGTGVVDRVLPLPAIAAVLNQLGKAAA